MPIKMSDLKEALAFVSAHGAMDAFISRETGHVFWQSEDMDDVEDVPDDLDDETKYARLPAQKDLDLGKEVAMDFTQKTMPEAIDNVRDIFRRKGAFGRFKDFLSRKGKLEAWYGFEEKAQEKALRNWCETQGLEVTG